MKSIRTRDPKPMNRDPEPETHDPKPEQTDPASKRNAIPCVPEVAAQCPKCHSTVSQIDATRPELAKGFILKYRTCKACGKKFASRQNQKPIEQWPAVAGVDI